MNNTIISARGHAFLEVAPDVASISVQLKAAAPNASAARSQIAAQLADFSARLEGLGLVVATPGLDKPDATYLRHRVSVSRQRYYDNDKRQWVNLDMFDASASITVSLRNFGLLNAMTQLAASADGEVSGPRWSVDIDNPDWRTVRRNAVRESFLQAQDYAEALGGNIVGLEHLAEPGLLGTDNGSADSSFGAPRAAMKRSGQSDDLEDEIDLTPVPQTLSATVEARYLVEANDIVSALR